jgi:hypothetical protein
MSRFYTTYGDQRSTNIGDNLPIPNIEEKLFAESVVNGGVVTNVDPVDIANNALQEAQNCFVRYDRTERRPGSTQFGPDAPDAEAVMRMVFVKYPDGTGHTIRITPTTINELVGGAWVPVVDSNIAGEELNGTSADRISTAMVLNRFVIANNGVNEIQEVDLVAGTFAKLGNAPKYRYITGFANRLVGAALRDVNEIQIGWSATFPDTDEWSSVVNDSAGNTPLIDSPSDLSDFITGIFGWTDVMLVAREKSLWLATKQPIAQDPFYFRAAVPGIGCDSPHSMAVTGDGLAFVDRRTQNAYIYVLGQRPEQIADPIKNKLLDAIKDPRLIFSAYDAQNTEYSICIPKVGTKLIDVWTYNRMGRTWSQQQYYDLTTFDDVEVAGGGSLVIDQLSGMIDDLIGTIDDLSPDTGSLVGTRIRGHGDGSITTDDVLAAIDAPHADYAGGYPFETVITSKVFNQLSVDTYFTKTVLEIECSVADELTVEFSKDGGKTWKLKRSFTPTSLNVAILLRLIGVVRSRRFCWRLRCKGGLFALLSYWVHSSVAGESK